MTKIHTPSADPLPYIPGSVVNLNPMDTYRHRVNGGPRKIARPTEKKSDIQARADMLDRMVNRFAERIRVLEAIHTVRLEEAGLILSTIFLLYRRWREEHPEEPDRGSAFTYWVERLTAEHVITYLTNKDGQRKSGILASALPDESDEETAGFNNPDEN